MADNTSIEWTDATWNPITGCSIVSPGCTNCYAMKLAGTRLKHTPSRKGLTVDSKAGPVWNGQVRLNEQWLDQPLRWKRPRRIFVCAHGDLFAENVPDEWIDRVFAVMALAPQHTFQVLTKRAARMRAYMSGFECDGARRFHVADAAGRAMQDGDNAHDYVVNLAWPLPNVWLGVSAERQQEADERIPELLATPAAIRFVSAEPLLGPITFRWAKWDDWRDDNGRRRAVVDHLDGLRRLDWIIAGGESGANARPMNPAWVRSIRDQCAAAGTAFFFKQWGEYLGGIGDDSGDGVWFEAASRHPDSRWLKNRDTFGWFDPAEAPSGPMHLKVGKKASGRLLDGVEYSEFPELPEVPFR
jgi:protein gp37